MKKKPKRILLIVFFLVALFFSCKLICDHLYAENYKAYLYDLSNSGSGIKYKVNIKTEMYNYNHLGTDITYEHSYRGNLIHSGDILLLKGNNVPFKTKIVEHDSIDDVGYVSINFDMRYHYAGASRTSTKIVYEDGGKRYADAYAYFDITYTLIPIIEPNEYFKVVFFKSG